MSIENDNPVDAEISDLYRTTQSEEGPSAALDAAILAQAEAATKPKAKRPVWIAPVGLAATVLLGVNLAINLKDYSSQPDVYSESSSVLSAKKSEQVADSESVDSSSSAYDEAADQPAPVLKSVAEDRLTASETTGLNQPASLPAEDRERESAPSETRPASENTVQPNRRIVADEPMDFASRSPSTMSTGNEVVAEQVTEEHQSAKPAPQPMVAVTGSRIPRESNSEASAREERQVAIQESAQQAARPSADNATVNTSEDKLVSPRAAPVMAEATNDASPLLDTSTPAPAPVPQMIASEGESDLEEVIVSGAKRTDTDSSPHRRLNAKDQVARNSNAAVSSLLGGEETNYAGGSATQPSQSAFAQPYICDLTALKIDNNAVEQAKVDARLLEPPLNAATWPGYIHELAETGDYETACAQLAAYHQLFPDVALIAPLRLVLLPQKTDN